MDYHKIDGPHMTPQSNTWHHTYTTQQNPPQYYGNKTASTINFTLVVNDFGVKYYGKEHALHLNSELEVKYKVTVYWDVKLYVKISLTWDHDKGTVKISTPGRRKRGNESPYPWIPPQYGNTNQILMDNNPAEELDTMYQKHLQKIVGKFMYYAQAIDSTMLMALNSMEELQTNTPYIQLKTSTS